MEGGPGAASREFPFAVVQPLADLLKHQRDQTRELERKKARITAPVFHRTEPSRNELSKSFEQAKFDTSPTR